MIVKTHMTRLPIILAALLATAAPLGFPDFAQAQGKGKGAERREQRRDERPRKVEPAPQVRGSPGDDSGRASSPSSRSFRQGSYLPPAYENGRIVDYARYRLRPPPRGYAWVRVGRSYALVSLATGQVFEMVPF